MTMATSFARQTTETSANEKGNLVMLSSEQPTRTPVDWQTGLPALLSLRVSLRELMPSDAQSLHDLIATPDVQRYLAPGPKSVRDFEQFIRWTHETRESGQYACFGVVPKGCEAAVGVFQVWPVEPGFATAEWGFALGAPFWGTGMFQECAQLVIDFAIETMGVRRLEARAAADNPRANGALRKLGAVHEGTLRRCHKVGNEYRDHAMWSILADEWVAGSEREAETATFEGVPALQPSLVASAV
ncbi:MAG: hypothetical protein CL471_11650 [Acidobacteria bacterium]|nr:hypothetical protein [Acidobacteriota bacterium]